MYNSDHRRDYSSSTGGGGGRGGGYHRGGGGYRGGHRGGGGGYRGGYRGGGRRGGGRGYQHHHPYPRSGSNQSSSSNTNNTYGNRFPDRPSSATPLDPQQQVVGDLLRMVTKVGALTDADVPEADQQPQPQQENSNKQPQLRQQRPLVVRHARNVQLLTDVVCGSNRSLFLRYNLASVAAAEHYGAVATHLHDCAATLPLQTHTHAALAVALHEADRLATANTATTTDATTDATTPSSSNINNNSTSGFGFLPRAVEYGAKCLCRDLDQSLLLLSDTTTANTTTIHAAEDRARTFTRLRLQLRYWAVLECQLNVFGNGASTTTIAATTTTTTAMEDHHVPSSSSSTSSSSLQFASLRQLLAGLARAAQAAVQRDQNKHAAFALASLILSTIPYIVVAKDGDDDDNNSNNNAWIESHLLLPLEELLNAHYVSAFAPGVGCRAVLLKDEQVEEQDGDDEDSGDEDEDDEEEEAAAQVCDTLQDLLRTVKFYLEHKSSSRLALFTDAPWGALTAPSAAAAAAATGGAAEGGADATTANAATATATAPPPLRYTGEPLTLNVSARSIETLLAGKDDDNSDSNNNKTPPLALHDLTGAVYGRLPIFGPPPDLAVDDDDDDENEGMGDDDDNANDGGNGSPGGSGSTAATTTHERRLRCYQTKFGLVDRHFLGESVRDLLLCHQPSVSEVGVERGSCKTAAEQVWSLRFMVVNNSDDAAAKAANNGENEQQAGSSNNNDTDGDPSKGIEYAILETILSLVVQCSSSSAASSSSSSSSAFSLVYLARVVLELTKLEPALLSPAIVSAVSALFQDYMPALTPLARHNLSRWLAFHLIHTDYQWPAGYWKIWEPFVAATTTTAGWRNSRGAFVRGTLQAMVENLSSPELLVTECLPKGSLLVDQLVPKGSPQLRQDTSALAALQTDIQHRIGSKEEPDKILQYLLSSEVAELHAGAVGSLADPKWWKTGVVLRALLRPAAVDHERLVRDIEKAKEAAADENDEMEQDDEAPYKEDVLTLVGDAMKEYKPVLLGVMEKEAETQGDAGTLAGEICLLHELHSTLFYSRSLLSACVQAMLSDGLLSVEKILQWLLGETGGDDDQATIVLQWWELATASIHQGMMKAAASFDATARDSNEMEGVEEESTSPDSGAAGNAKKIKLLLQFLDPLLSYIVARSGTLLGSMNDVTKGHKLLPDQVEIVEGCKTVVTDSEAIFSSLLSGSAPSSQLHDAWVESAVAGPRLASLLDVGGAAAVEMLRMSLERM